MNLTKEQELGFIQIELRVTLQRAIELIDDLNLKSNEIKNKKLQSNLKSVYGVLDKETKKYNDLFEATAKGTTAFYEIVVANNLLVMRNNIIEKNLINKAVLANEINPKALEGILNKILKENDKI
jgi:hypothetical protein